MFWLLFDFLYRPICAKCIANRNLRLIRLEKFSFFLVHRVVQSNADYLQNEETINFCLLATFLMIRSFMNYNFYRNRVKVNIEKGKEKGEKMILLLFEVQYRNVLSKILRLNLWFHLFSKLLLSHNRSQNYFKWFSKLFWTTSLCSLK